MLDFQGNTEAVEHAFQDYYRTTLLADETDPNKLHDLKAALDASQVYGPAAVDELVERFLADAPRDQLDAVLDPCATVYVTELDEDAQVAFKSQAKAFCRTHGFLSAILPYSPVAWEKLAIFLNLLLAKLPAPREEDLARGILETIDMDSYRVERKTAIRIALADQEAEIAPIPADAAGHLAEPELDRLSNILKNFNDQFGTLFTDADRVAKRIREELAPKVAADLTYQNAKLNTPHTARLAHNQALDKIMQGVLLDDTQFYKQFVENESFREYVRDAVFKLTA